MIKECPICREIHIETIHLDYPLFSHLGFVNFKNDGVIGRCPGCQLLMNMMSPSKEKRLSDIYESFAYAQKGNARQTFLIDSKNKRATRFFIQAEILKKYLCNSVKTRVLDIGCFHGELLFELSKRFPMAEFHGFDVNEHLKDFFPLNNNFKFWLSDLSKIDGKFDLIIMSLSMAYIKDINGLLMNIRRLLKKGGYLFIQLIDIAKNPYSVLLADQHYYFTPGILKNILRKKGFCLRLCSNHHFPRDIVGIARLAPNNNDYRMKKDSSIHQSIEYLDRVRKKVSSIPKQSRLCVLGTTTIAAFIDSMLGERIQVFIDEDIYKIEGEARFRGKKVIPPQLVDKSMRLILPFGPKNMEIKERFQRDYSLKNFELI